MKTVIGAFLFQVCQRSNKDYGNFPIATQKIESCGPFVDDETPVIVTYAEVFGRKQ